MPTISDSELVLRLQADDAEAFDALYRQYNQYLHASIFKVTRDAEATSDMEQIQNVLIQIGCNLNTSLLHPWFRIFRWMLPGLDPLNNAVSNFKI